MQNILAIFKYDLKTLSKHFFAMVVALAICLLPSLYAWMNIYSNWDPYGNTGNISIALSSMDKGYVTDDGEAINKGEEVLDNLREATSINWVFLDDETEAVNGVYSGDYYAAVVIDEDFSYNMFNMLSDWTGKPSITYYENAKKNAVATKITDTAAESVKTSINEAYLQVVVNTIMESANRIAEDIESDDPSGTFHGIIKQAVTTLQSADKTMAAFSAATAGVSLNGLDTQKLDELLLTMQDSMPAPDDIRATVAGINMSINEANAKVEEALRVFQDANAPESSLASAKKLAEQSAASFANIARLSLLREDPVRKPVAVRAGMHTGVVELHDDELLVFLRAGQCRSRRVGHHHGHSNRGFGRLVPHSRSAGGLPKALPAHAVSLRHGLGA